MLFRSNPSVLHVAPVSTDGTTRIVSLICPWTYLERTSLKQTSGEQTSGERTSEKRISTSPIFGKRTFGGRASPEHASWEWTPPEPSDSFGEPYDGAGRACPAPSFACAPANVGAGIRARLSEKVLDRPASLVYSDSTGGERPPEQGSQHGCRLHHP